MTPAPSAKLSVVASFSILGDMAQRIGGEQIDLKVLVGHDGDAHVYEPTPGDAKAISSARLLIVNGLHFDEFMDRLRKSSHFEGKVCVATKGVTPRKMLEDGQWVEDPHAWQNLEHGMRYAENIAQALGESDPSNRNYYQQRLAAYKKELTDLNIWVKKEIQSVPTGKRKVISAHDAFGYFGEAYGVTFVAPSGWSTESEPTAKDVSALVDQIKKEKIKAIFSENMNDPRLIRQIAADAGAFMGGELYSDALSEKGKGAGNYPGMFRHNVKILTEAMAKN